MLRQGDDAIAIGSFGVTAFPYLEVTVSADNQRILRIPIKCSESCLL